MQALEEKTIGDFSDKEIREEYIERFGDPDSLDGFKSDELIDELEARDDMPEPEVPEPDRFDEIMELIAEAARTAPHAVKAYELLRDAFSGHPTLTQRQSLIAGRMGGIL